MVNSYKRFWENILNFSGTSGRADYWWPVIINYVLGGLIIAIINTLLGHPINDIYNLNDLSVNTVARIVSLIVWIGTISVKIRRLHDSDHVGWWILIDLIPLIGTIWFFVLMVLPTRRNRWENK
ncbi:DUF805 domain-containing protein [Lentilactobacillus sp. SPB1-3]|uniref:DUF805 domain-containing protein n=1 Tax=Lentilactobacillus terminaliae TaxID=3003483 RepID=A0ACD5DBV8_9LACO|nr:DUF805 domain-containing protein [Lentilactobacillus sp. SPB1-3]MCZ0977133.1 DUF805 domain-containing protein [Lentilactobacillus sp. SPB1-3]